MESRVPVPTDNIYKFYALFGIALFISSCLAYLYIYDTHLDNAQQLIVKVSVLENKAELSSDEKDLLALYQRIAEIADSNRNFYGKIVAFAMCLSFMMVVYGFYEWHYKIQPKYDRMLDSQIEKLELEIAALHQTNRFKRKLGPRDD